MGECLISRRGGEAYKLPVLNTEYPQDVTVKQSASGSATFSVLIAEDGVPKEYTYQWYENGEAISGATNTIYTKTGITSSVTAGSYTIFCRVYNKAGYVDSRHATLTVQNYYPTISGSYTFTEQDDINHNWTIKVTSSTQLVFDDSVDVNISVVGGGAGGAGGTGGDAGGAGGGGGKVKNSTITLLAGTYTATIGSRGTGGSVGGNGTAGGSSSFVSSDGSVNISANGGAAKGGGAGGSGTGVAGTKGAAGTYLFGDSSQKRYGASGGGGGAKQKCSGGAGGADYGGKGGTGAYPGVGATAGSSVSTANTGSGGGGGGGAYNDATYQGNAAKGGNGSAGVIFIRNAR